nr:MULTISPECIES: FtsQ-type POTRA domain-containing protein [unclassified Enterococcus]
MLAFPITVFFLSPLSKLSAIEVSGNQNESSKAVVKASQLTVGESILAERKKMNQVEPNLQEKFKRIKSATVSYSFPNRFVIKIKEKAELAYVQENDILKVVLVDGTILDDKVETQNESYPVIKAFKSTKKIKKLVAQYQRLSPELRGQIKLIELTPTNANSDFLTLTMADGNQVKITLEDIDDKMKYYPEVASQMTEKGIVDMEAGIYSYPYPQS